MKPRSDHEVISIAGICLKDYGITGVIPGAFVARFVVIFLSYLFTNHITSMMNVSFTRMIWYEKLVELQYIIVLLQK